MLARPGPGRLHSFSGQEVALGRPAAPASRGRAVLGHGKLAHVYSSRSPKNRPEEGDGCGVAGSARGVWRDRLTHLCVQGRLRLSRVLAQGHSGLRRITRLHR